MPLSAAFTVSDASAAAAVGRINQCSVLSGPPALWLCLLVLPVSLASVFLYLSFAALLLSTWWCFCSLNLSVAVAEATPLMSSLSCCCSSACWPIWHIIWLCSLWRQIIWFQALRPIYLLFLLDKLSALLNNFSFTAMSGLLTRLSGQGSNLALMPPLCLFCMLLCQPF